MGNYTNCPDCMEDSLDIPLRQKGESLICPLCEYEVNN
jgi:hypothetical protein